MSSFEFKVPEPDILLPLELNSERGGRSISDASERLDHAFVIGRPAVRQIKSDLVADNDELQRFLLDNKDNQYHLVGFACTLTAEKPLSFHQAWLRIALETAGGNEPIARSMEPTMLTVSQTLSTRVQIGGRCFLIPLIEISKTATTEHAVLQARHEGTSNPEWWMFQRESSKIDGLQRFRLIVEAPAKTNIRGTISFGATLKGRRGPLRYQVPLHDATQLDWLVIKTAAGKVWPGRSK
jgi:hypothetical protein